MRQLFRTPFRAVLALLLCLLTSMPAFASPSCGASDVARVAQKASALATMVRTFDPAGQLLAERLITPDEAEVARVKTSVLARAVTEFDAGVSAALEANPKATLIDLLPAFAATVNSLNELGALRFDDPRAQTLFDRTLSGIRITLAGISAFYVARIATARNFLAHPRGESVERRACEMAGVEYEPQRIARARELLKSRGLSTAFSDYYDVEITESHLALVSAAAG